MSMMPVEIDVETRTRAAVVSFTTKQLTHLEMDEVCVELMERVRLHNTRHFVLDFSEVEFLASACVGALVAFLQDLEPMHGRVMLANCRPEVAFIFKVTRLDNIFPIFDDVSDAIEELEGL